MQILVQSKFDLNEQLIFNRDSRPLVFCKKAVLKNISKLTENICHRVATLQKRWTLTHVFSREFCEISQNGFFVEYILATVLFYFIFLHFFAKFTWKHLSKASFQVKSLLFRKLPSKLNENSSLNFNSPDTRRC